AGWQVGDWLIVTSTGRTRINNRGTLRAGANPVVGGKPGDYKALPYPGAEKPGVSGPARKSSAQTEERGITAIDGDRLTLDRPRESGHPGDGDSRGEVADLSRNVVIEWGAPRGARGHTMYHRHSAGSISYAEFRHLGKEGQLGKYPIHFH